MCMKTVKNILVVNDEGATARFYGLTFNLLPKLCRMEKLEDRDHLVIPMVMINEGVHHGSFGPLLYQTEELAKTPEAWNHKPVVVYHPEKNGKGISACSAEVINTRKVGVIMNTRLDGKALKAEAWLEKERSNKVDNRIVEAIEKEEIMELSTGMFLDIEKKAGVFNGEEYEGVAKNFRPDHLALLPDQIGACSIADGAGLGRNASGGIANGFKSIMRKMGLLTNELSHNSMASQLYQALNRKFNAQDTIGNFCYVEDVFQNFVVYHHNNRFWRLSYTASDTSIALGNESPVEVVRTTEYRKVAANSSPGKSGQGQTENTDNTMKKTKVDAIIAANSGWQEIDRDALMALSETQLDIIANIKTATAPPAASAAAPAAAAAATPAAPAAAATNTVTTPPPKTVEEFISNAPAEMQDVLRSGLSTHKEEKARLVGLVKASKTNTFKDEYLNARSIEELRALVQLSGGSVAPAPAANYAGQGPVGGSSTEAEPVLELPALNFESAKK